MDPMTMMAALKFLQGGGGKKVLDLFGGALGDKAGPLGDLLGGSAEAGPGETALAAVAMLAAAAPTDATAFDEFMKGVADAVRGIAVVRSRAR